MASVPQTTHEVLDKDGNVIGRYVDGQFRDLRSPLRQFVGGPEPAGLRTVPLTPEPRRGLDSLADVPLKTERVDLHLKKKGQQ